MQERRERALGAGGNLEYQPLHRSGKVSEEELVKNLNPRIHGVNEEDENALDDTVSVNKGDDNYDDEDDDDDDDCGYDGDDDDDDVDDDDNDYDDDDDDDDNDNNDGNDFYTCSDILYFCIFEML